MQGATYFGTLFYFDFELIPTIAQPFMNYVTLNQKHRFQCSTEIEVVARA